MLLVSYNMMMYIYETVQFNKIYQHNVCEIGINKTCVAIFIYLPQSVSQRIEFSLDVHTFPASICRIDTIIVGILYIHHHALVINFN